MKAYRQALADANINFKPELIVECNNSYDEGMEAVKELKPYEPTAYFVNNDEMAIGVIHAVEEGGQRIPEDVEIISYENSKLARMARPMLSSVALPLYDIGAVSMRLLTKYMNKEEIDENQVILPYRIEERQSTKNDQI